MEYTSPKKSHPELPPLPSRTPIREKFKLIISKALTRTSGTSFALRPKSFEVMGTRETTHLTASTGLAIETNVLPVSKRGLTLTYSEGSTDPGSSPLPPGLVMDADDDYEYYRHYYNYHQQQHQGRTLHIVENFDLSDSSGGADVSGTTAARVPTRGLDEAIEQQKAADEAARHLVVQLTVSFGTYTTGGESFHLAVSEQNTSEQNTSQRSSIGELEHERPPTLLLAFVQQPGRGLLQSRNTLRNLYSLYLTANASRGLSMYDSTIGPLQRNTATPSLLEQPIPHRRSASSIDSDARVADAYALGARLHLRLASSTLSDRRKLGTSETATNRHLGFYFESEEPVESGTTKTRFLNVYSRAQTKFPLLTPKSARDTVTTTASSAFGARTLYLTNLTSPTDTRHDTRYDSYDKRLQALQTDLQEDEDEDAAKIPRTADDSSIFVPPYLNNTAHTQSSSFSSLKGKGQESFKLSRSNLAQAQYAAAAESIPKFHRTTMRLTAGEARPSMLGQETHKAYSPVEESFKDGRVSRQLYQNRYKTPLKLKPFHLQPVLSTGSLDPEKNTLVQYNVCLSNTAILLLLIGIFVPPLCLVMCCGFLDPSVGYIERKYKMVAAFMSTFVTVLSIVGICVGFGVGLT